MFGIGPMLPVIPAAEDRERHYARKARKRKQKDMVMSGSRDLAANRRRSTIKTETTLTESNDGDAKKESERSSYHQRDLSVTVNWTKDDIERMAKELDEGVISDLDLSLFAFWIKAKHENYLFARDFVRELALDQGYNVDRVSNTHVRKLLQEVHDARPRCVPGERSSLKLAATDESRHNRRKSLIDVLSPVKARGKVWFAAIDESAKTRSNTVHSRDSQRASPWESPFLNKTRSSNMRSIGSIRAVTSPLTARMETLPPALRLGRERAVQEASRITTVSSSIADYPPNTPDRPAPLSVKSRRSQASTATPVPTTILRSVSTPIPNQARGDLDALPHARASIPTRDNETRSLISMSTPNNSASSTSDIFDTTQGRDCAHSNSFTDRLNSSQDEHRGTNSRYMYNNADDNHQPGPFQLDISDVASESSYGTFGSFVRKNIDRASSGMAYDGSIIGDDSFDALESYVGSEEEDECSLLESTSTISEHKVQTQYQYAVPAPSISPILGRTAPTPPQRRSTVDTRRKTQASAFNSPAVSFHRPLPLRSYESEASMFPTAGAHANSGRNRAKSVTSIIASRRYATETMHLPPLPSSGQACSSSNIEDLMDCKRDGSHTKISEQLDQYVATISRRSSSASTLAAFPIPPMDNPVGELPMLVSRATSSPQAPYTTPSYPLLAPASLEDTYRAITKVNMVALLQRTRDRGKQLQVIEWNKLSSFERAWREMNEVLLVTIYGRKDVVLGETDVAYVDCIAREVRGASGEDVPTDWVRRIFED